MDLRYRYTETYEICFKDNKLEYKNMTWKHNQLPSKSKRKSFKHLLKLYSTVSYTSSRKK